MSERKRAFFESSTVLILNRYRPISEAGSGGFATVQLAWDTRIQRRVAIKIISLTPEEIPVAMAVASVPYFDDNQRGIYETAEIESVGNMAGLVEARTAAMLNDPSIVGVYDFQVEGSTAYLIMEYVDGLTLTDLMNDYRDLLSLDIVAAVFSSVARALEVAHENQVLHLDIKPDNILINHQGQVKVTDFGLSALSGSSGFSAAKGGTIGYMPPEQMRQENLDERCDEWSLASITYEMLVGENPFLAFELDQAEKAILEAELVLPSLCFEGLPTAADEVLFYALDPNREERYADISDFAEEMKRFLGDPEKGQHQLAVIIEEACEDLEDEEEPVEEKGLFDRFGPRGRSVLARVWSVLSVGLLSLIALSNISLLEGMTDPFFWGIFALIIVGAAIKPHLGAILGLLTFSVALFINNAIILGAIFLVASVFWWFFVGRKGNSPANTAVLPALLGAFGLNQMTPMLTGYLLNMKEAIVNTVFALFLSLTLASLGSQSIFGWSTASFLDFGNPDIQQNALHLIRQPFIWCIALSWLVSAIVVRLFCKSEKRPLAVLGIFLGTAFLIAGIFLGTWVDTGSISFATSNWFAFGFTIGAGVVLAALCGLGIPLFNTDNEV